MRDRRIWGAAISLSLVISGTLGVQPATASRCCSPPPPCCYYDHAAEVILPAAPSVTEDATVSWAYIDTGYVFTKVLVPIIYAILILRILWLIQLK